MIKQFSAGDITVRPFSTFKAWTVQSIDSSSVDKYNCPTYYNDRCEVNTGIKLSTPFYPSGSPYWLSSNDPINSSGKYARNVYYITDGMFYKNAQDPLKIFGVEYYTQDPKTGKKEVREIHDKIVTLNLKHNVWGEKIVPESVQIIDDSNPNNTLKIYDDGYTNLYVTGSHFLKTEELGAVRENLATRYWVTSSGQFYVLFNDGTTQSIDLTNARQYMAMGQNVIYVDANSGSSWAWDTSSYQNIYQANNDHFGESVSCWRNYVAVGSSMDQYSLSNNRLGYASIFKYDENTDSNRLIKKINFPFTQSAADTSSYFKDSFGSSVAIRDNFLAVGSPTGSACSSSIYPGYVCVYDKNKGGPDNWGIINILRGQSDKDKFGASVAIDNDILAIGATAYSSSLGAVYIFRKKRYMDTEYPCQNINTSSYWQQVVTAGDFCSELTGSLYATQSYTPTFVSGNYTWIYETTLTSSVGATGDNFGYSISVDMNQLIVGTNKTGDGYAALFTCSYYSASAQACPTASWAQVQLFAGNNSSGDLNVDLPEYSVDVTGTIVSDKFGQSVSISNKNIVIGCQYDKAYIPYNGYAGNSVVLGAAYFYHFGYVADCLDYQFHLVTKTFGNREYITNNNFAKAVSVDGTTAVVTSLADTLGRKVNFSGSAYILENYSYASTGSNDSVLGRASIYNYDYTNNSWYMSGELRRNKEANHPYNIYGYSVSVSSDFVAVGGPIVNLATASAYNSIINQTSQSLYMPSSYSGSAYTYDLRKYEKDPKIGNVFYKNGYFVITSTGSNFSSTFTGTGSRGFELNYRGAHTIFEHEYLVSVRPGEFNYSSNPSALAQYPMTFDVNQDGVVDINDVNLVMRYLRMKKFYAEFVFDEDGLILEQDTLSDYSWWANDLLQTEAEDVLKQESSYPASLTTSSFDVFTKAAYEYIEAKLDKTGLLDIDGNGEINLNDGYLFALYVAERLNPSSIAPYIDASSSRQYAVDIQKYLDKYCGADTKSVNPEFLNYQYSSSYDATGSFLAPYITTIGLYQDNQLVAVGKLGRPIKNLIDWPVNIVVRFDT